MKRLTRSRGLAMTIALAAITVALVPAMSASATGTGSQGCTPGYWKNHLGAWQEYSPTQKVGAVFGTTLPQANDTLLQALGYGGGSDLNSARRILLRAAVAATLNAAHDSLGFPLRRFAAPPAPSGFIPVVKSLLAGTNRSAIISYATYLDRLNNLGCPLN